MSISTRRIALTAATLMFALSPFYAQADVLTSSQIQAIIGLLQSFGADAAAIANVQSAISGSGGLAAVATAIPTASKPCINLNYNMTVGSLDAQTAGQVSKLQQFLAMPVVTGDYERTTMQWVQTWQSTHGILSSGSYNTNGFGAVGPTTRAAMACPNPVSATIDQSSLSATMGNIVLTGTAQNTSALTIDLVTQSGGLVDPGIPVVVNTNGHWSVSGYNLPNVPAGMYVVNVYNQTNSKGTIPVLATGILTVTATASLSVTADPSTPMSANVIAGTASVNVGTYDFKASGSSYTVQKLEILLPTGPAAGLPSSVTLQYHDVNGTPQTSTQSEMISSSGNNAQFTGLSLFVPSNGVPSVVTVSVSIPTIASGSVSGSVIATTIAHASGFQAVDAAGNLVTSFGSSDVSPNAAQGLGDLYIRKSIPTVTRIPVTSALSSGQPVYQFSVSADPAGAINLDKLSFNIVATNVSVSTYLLIDETAAPISLAPWSTAPASGSTLVVIPTTPIQIAAGTTKTFELFPGTVSTTSTNSSLSVTLLGDTTLVSNTAASSVLGNFVWTDRSANSDSLTATDWTNGYLVKATGSTQTLTK